MYEDWLPAFCNDERRQYPLSDFRKNSVRISDFDAGYFLAAVDKGLVKDLGGGRYTCAQSEAHEQLFWTGARSKSPRPITLWVEPVITIGTIARLKLAFGWPRKLLGMQSKGWAFDFTAFHPDRTENEYIAGEVKKSAREIDVLLEDVCEFAAGDCDSCPSDKSHVVNSFRKGFYPDIADAFEKADNGGASWQKEENTRRSSNVKRLRWRISPA